MTATADGARSRSAMPLAGHLREARVRLRRASLALVVGLVVGWLMTDAVLDVLRGPVTALAESRDATLNYTSVSAAFELKTTIALCLAVVLSAPVWLWQLLGFCLPGLTRRERRWTLGFVAAAVPLFAAGCVAGFAVFPHIVEVLAQFASTDDSTVLDASAYVTFVLTLVGAMGIAFVLPVVVVLLNVIGVLPGATVLRGWRVVLIGIVLFCAVATPAADVTSMFLLAVPLAVLFAAAAGVALLHDRAVARRAAADGADPRSAVADPVAA